MVIRLALIRTTAIAFVFFPGLIAAGYGCVLESLLPQTYVYPNENGETVWAHRFPERFTYGRDTRFDACKKLLPALPEATRADFERYRPELLEKGYEEFGEPLAQAVRSCTVSGDYIYFGLEVYHGEGARELGGLGRFDRVQKSWEIRRDHGFAGDSITDLVVDDGIVYLLSEYETEGTTQASGGLLRYDWQEETLITLPNAARVDEPGPCQARFHGMGRVGNDLWVGGDLGLSKLDLQTGRWTHHVSRQIGDSLEQIACQVLLQELAVSLPDTRDKRDEACDLDSDNTRGQLFTMLFEHRLSLFNLVAEPERKAIMMKEQRGPLYEFRVAQGWLTEDELAKQEADRQARLKWFQLPELQKPESEQP